MTAEELIRCMNADYNSGPWPDSIEVDAETYANCCKYVFAKRDVVVRLSDYEVIELMITPNKNLLFKNVELILK